MASNEKDLVNFLEKKAKEAWSGHGQPYLISSVAADFKAECGVDYKDILGPERLKSAVSRLGQGSDFKVVFHPSQRAKIGIIPNAAEFSFREDVSKDGGDAEKKRAAGHRQRIVLSFLDLLHGLPKEELESVNIPTNVLVKLLKDQ